MPHGKTKFQQSWLEKTLDDVLLKEWCEPVDGKIYFAKCNLCVDEFDISGSGISQVKSHHNGKKHTVKFKAKFKTSGKGSIIDAFRQRNSPVDNALSHDMQVTRAETLWALKVAEGNMSFKSCNETVDLFKIMFPDSEIASQMQLKEK